MSFEYTLQRIRESQIRAEKAVRRLAKAPTYTPLTGSKAIDERLKALNDAADEFIRRRNDQDKARLNQIMEILDRHETDIDALKHHS